MTDAPDPEAHAQYVRELLGDMGTEIDTNGLELVRLVHMVANLYDAIALEQRTATGMSGPRWRLLLRLMAEEKHGRTPELTPTYLSRCQNVSKNTISVLLKGLEEQGFVERAVDARDRRVARIRLSSTGRALIRASAPANLARLNDLASDLTPQERGQLAQLLAKLHRSLAAHAPSPAVARVRSN